MSAGEIALVLTAVLLGAVVKSTIGMGLPLVAIPVIAVATSPATAIAVIALPNAVHNGVLLLQQRRHRRDTVGLAPFVVAGVLGAALASLTVGNVADTVSSSVLLVIVVAYLVTTVRAPELRLDRRRAVRWSPAVGAVAGAFQGGAGISGPIVGSWHHALHLPRDAFVYSVTVVFALTGATQFVVLLATGTLGGLLSVSALLTVVVVGTIPLGTRLRRQLSGRGFERLVLVLLGVSAVALAADLVVG